MSTYTLVTTDSRIITVGASDATSSSNQSSSVSEGSTIGPGVSAPRSAKIQVAPIIGGSLAAVVLLGLCATVICIRRRRHKQRRPPPLTAFINDPTPPSEQAAYHPGVGDPIKQIMQIMEDARRPTAGNQHLVGPSGLSPILTVGIPNTGSVVSHDDAPPSYSSPQHHPRNLPHIHDSSNPIP